MSLLCNVLGQCGLDSTGLGKDLMSGCYEHGVAPSLSIRGGEFLD